MLQFWTFFIIAIPTSNEKERAIKAEAGGLESVASSVFKPTVYCLEQKKLRRF